MIVDVNENISKPPPRQINALLMTARKIGEISTT
jgi:hypothetical protein